MRVEMRPIDSIRPYENNPRLNDDAVDAVARSIQEFGWRQPIVIDETGVIVAGHTRYKAALKLGLETVPVHVALGLSEAQLKAYRLADNQTARLSDWDEDKLPIELMALQEMDFDLDLTGFSGDELMRSARAGDRSLDRPRRYPGAARRGDHATRRLLGPGQPPPVVRRRWPG